jgi:hypothetical protein
MFPQDVQLFREEGGFAWLLLELLSLGGPTLLLELLSLVGGFP